MDSKIPLFHLTLDSAKCDRFEDYKNVYNFIDISTFSDEKTVTIELVADIMAYRSKHRNLFKKHRTFVLFSNYDDYKRFDEIVNDDSEQNLDKIYINKPIYHGIKNAMYMNIAKKNDSLEKIKRYKMSNIYAKDLKKEIILLEGYKKMITEKKHKIKNFSNELMQINNLEDCI